MIRLRFVASILVAAGISVVSWGCVYDASAPSDEGVTSGSVPQGVKSGVDPVLRPTTESPAASSSIFGGGGVVTLDRVLAKSIGTTAEVDPGTHPWHPPADDNGTATPTPGGTTGDGSGTDTSGNSKK